MSSTSSLIACSAGGPGWEGLEETQAEIEQLRQATHQLTMQSVSWKNAIETLAPKLRRQLLRKSLIGAGRDG